MNFKIGTIARLLSMSSEGLRLYERCGILRPRRSAQNNDFRTYEYLDFTALIHARGYHYLGFSTQEIARLLNSDNIDNVLAQYTKREQDLKDEIRTKQLLLEHLQQLSQLSASAQGNLGKITQSTRPAMYRFPFARNTQFILKKEQEPRFRVWIQNSPVVFLSQNNDWNALLQGQAQKETSLGIMEEDAKRLSLDVSCAQYYPACPCLYSIVEEQGEVFQPLVCLAGLMDYVQTHRVSVAGDPIARTFLFLDKEQNYTRFREVWLPIHAGE